MYSIPTVVHLCCTQAWWGPGEADSSSTSIENLKKKNKKKKMLLSKEDPKQETAVPLRPAVFPLGHFFETTLLYFEERTFVELFVPYSTIYSCC